MSVIKKSVGILGGGIAGLSLAYFLNNDSVAVIEKNSQLGGLARSFNKNGLAYDIGPHIIFSKNEEVLKFMTSITPTHQLKRSNQIFLKGNFIKYPFENFLAMLKNQEDIDYCLNTFLNNPYKDMPANNMLTFFLKTFGEGITRLYLQPYNKKIWKFSPSMMDTQMVERIPKPPEEDIINSAKGKFSEGYLHQLYFSYPVSGGYQSMVDAVVAKAKNKGAEIFAGQSIDQIKFTNKKWQVKTASAEFEFSKIVNCMPVHELVRILEDVPNQIRQSLEDMYYNSIYIIIVNVKKDNIGDHFALLVPQSDVIFHRISKLDFLGESYHLPNSTSLLMEITYRDKDKYASITESQLLQRCVDDLIRIGFIDSPAEVNFTDFRREKYAYVIYDLNHRKNTDCVLEYLRSIGIESTGRFAEFEYLNSDKVIEHSMNLAQKLN